MVDGHIVIVMDKEGEEDEEDFSVGHSDWVVGF